MKCKKRSLILKIYGNICSSVLKELKKSIKIEEMVSRKINQFHV